jgi:hypothetical protein
MHCGHTKCLLADSSIAHLFLFRNIQPELAGGVGEALLLLV